MMAKEMNISPEESLQQEEINEIPLDVESVNDVEASGEWCFETDQAVLKNNKDYLNLLRTVVILEAQRIQAVNDLETVMRIKDEALSDPMAFVRKIENGESLGIPPRIIVAQIPPIDWSNYNTERPEPLKHVTRNASRSAVDIKVEEDERNRITVRGRAFDDTKPETFNQLWTMEEQQRLEELLIEFPPEEVETKRWGKIAAALGNRTGKQVSSRVQKYFIKLHRAGLPVPGRIPKVVGMGHRHQHQRNNYMLFKPTTFFPSRPRMTENDSFSVDTSFCNMSDLDGRYPGEEGGEENDEDMSDDDEDDVTMNIQEKVAEANTSRVANLLKLVSEEKDSSDNSSVKHFGYKCDYCHEEPLIGTRWHCIDCGKHSVDFCTDCVITQVYSANPHPLNHRLDPMRSLARPKTYDQDYATTSCGYNYLDPNFMPSNDE